MTGLPSAPPAGGTPKRARPVWALALFGLLALAGVAGLTALGIWQLERRVWKLDLIERVDARIHASPVPAPGPEAWPSVSAASDEYRRVAVTGHFLNDRETLVQAVTDLGGGFWVMTPLVTDRGFTVLVNRGFVPPEKRDPASRAEGQPQGEVSVTGLLRLTEPKGGFLRSNDPAAGRWYSRDVAAIAASKGLERVAPYFIDADGTRNPGGWPVGGLTVVSFPNSHLSYALTWFALDLMLIGAVLYVIRSEMRRRRA
ncbi:SURF1 family protein [Azospirillum sp. CT11-132]|uniref:SURF1 family protein n=1 Tax=Azospirillum sp. CT11-132 TaxID=3396317 RepID=UPI0039A7201E